MQLRKALLLLAAVVLLLPGTGCSGYVSVGLRDDGWCDCPEYRYRHKHDPFWYWDDYDGDGVINGRDDYPYDYWWW